MIRSLYVAIRPFLHYVPWTYVEISGEINRSSGTNENSLESCREQFVKDKFRTHDFVNFDFQICGLVGVLSLDRCEFLSHDRSQQRFAIVLQWNFSKIKNCTRKGEFFFFFFFLSAGFGNFIWNKDKTATNHFHSFLTFYLKNKLAKVASSWI